MRKCSYPYRTGNLDRLWAYVHLYFADDSTRPGKRRDLAAVLVVPRRTPSLDNDVAEMGLPWEDLTGGYWRVRGGLFTLYVVEIDVVAPEEGDDLLYSLGTGKLSTPEARRFWMELVGSQEAGMSMQDMEGYDELMAKLLDTLPPPPRGRLNDLAAGGGGAGVTGWWFCRTAGRHAGQRRASAR